MEGITLNTRITPHSPRSKTTDRSPKEVLRKKSKKIVSNGFSFEFGGSGQKVKAIVARKRPQAKTLTVSKSMPSSSIPTAKQESLTKETFALQNKTNLEARTSNQGKIKPTQDHKLPRSKSKVNGNSKVGVAKSSAQEKLLSRSSQSESFKTVPLNKEAKVESDNYSAKIATPPIGNDGLFLNVYSDLNAASLALAKKSKLARNNRINKKREKTKSYDATVPRILTQQEIDEGIRKFTENPNKKPRVAANKLPKEKLPPSQADHDHESNCIEVGKRYNDADLKPQDKPKKAALPKSSNLFEDNPVTKILGQRLVKPIRERIFDGTKVESLKLHPHCVKNLADLLSITELTTVQKKAIPPAMEGKDILVRSQTGSGKTLAYAIPIIEKLQAIRPKITRVVGILAVIIVPTRELAIQTYELFQKLLKPFTWIVAGVLMGGERRKAEKARLRKGINVLIGTPGRLVDHLLHTESFKLDKAMFLVLDEADRMLEMGYERDVKQIVEAIAKRSEVSTKEDEPDIQRLQRLLLSATLTPAVQKLAGLTLREPIFIDNSDEDPAKAIKSPSGMGYTKEIIEETMADTVFDDGDETGILTIPENLQLNYVVVPPKLRLVTISGLLAREFKGTEKFKVIVFMSTMEMVNFHHDLLNEQLTRKILDEEDEQKLGEGNDENENEVSEESLLKGLRFFKLHGSMTQPERQGVFKSFRECNSGVLLATDVAERGIDVPEVDLVIQYSPPQKIADFVHRVGRTARAGRSGKAVLFLTPSEAPFVRTLEEKRIRISQIDMDIYLKALYDADDEANTIQEAASNLQHKFENLIEDDKEMHDKACKAFVSWMKFYSTFPKELKPIFNVRNAHMGHFAKSFALKDQPTSFAKKYSAPKPLPPTNRLTYTERDPAKIKEEKRAKRRLCTTTVTNGKRNADQNGKHWFGKGINLLKRLPSMSLALNTSEFDSGLPAAKKKKK